LPCRTRPPRPRGRRAGPGGAALCRRRCHLRSDRRRDAAVRTRGIRHRSFRG
jgi:hypothetical protein